MGTKPHQTVLTLVLGMLICPGCQLHLDVMDPLATELSTARIEIPLRIRNGMMLVDVRLNGRGPFVFLVDTDSRMTFVSAKVTTQLQLPISIPEVNLYFDSDWQPIREVAHYLETLSIGGATFRDLNVVAMSDQRFIDSLSKTVGEQVCGFIGYNTFIDCLVTFDFNQSLMSLEYGELDSRAADTLPLRLDAYNPVIAVRFGTEAEEMVSVDMKLDTGSNGGFEMPVGSQSLPFESTPLPQRMARYYHGIGEKRRERVHTVAYLANHMIRNPMVSYYAGGAYLDSRFGRIGTEILRHYRLTFDSRNKLVRIVANPQAEQ